MTSTTAMVAFAPHLETAAGAWAAHPRPGGMVPPNMLTAPGWAASIGACDE